MRVYLFLFSLFVCAWGGINLNGYTLTFNQDFTTMSTLGVTSEGPITTANPWIAHRAPRNLDWVNFQDPSGDYQPFSLDGGVLTIRVQKQSSGTYTAGLLSSMDKYGNGFAQKYGYFECNAKLAAGLGTWPSFWLADKNSIVSGSDGHEIDIFEQYGDAPGIFTMTRHYWPNVSSISHWGEGSVTVQPDITNGFHLYGLDFQPDYLTFYFDREIVYQVPNIINAPGTSGLKYDRAMYMMLDNAYGGGGASNQPNPALNSGGPRDMQIKYVKVWQGSGGSSLASSNTNGANQYSFATDWSIQSNQPGIAIKGVSLNVSATGELIIYSTPSNSILWRNNVNTNCGSYCHYIYQGDGNFVGYGASGATWGTSTYNANASAVRFQNTAPYLSVVNQYGSPIWQSNAPTPAPTPTPTAKPTPTPTPKPTPTPTPKPTPTPTPTLPPSQVWNTAQFTLYNGQSVTVKGLSLRLNSSISEVTVVTSGGIVLFSFGTKDACGSSCKLVFQNDGNLVISTSNGVVWGASTYGNFQGKFIFQNSAPYLQVLSDAGSVAWSSGSAPLVYNTAGFTLANSASFTVNSVSLSGHPSLANAIVTSSSGSVLYTLATGKSCGTAGCSLVFQNDGNLVYYAGGSVVWAASTYNNFNGKFYFSSTSPYLQVQKDDGTVGWSSNW